MSDISFNSFSKALDMQNSRNFEEAEKYYESTLNELRKQGRKEEQSIVCGHMSELYFLMGNLTESISYYRKSLSDLYENDEHIATCNNNLGVALSLVSDPNDSIRSLNLSLRTYKSKNDKKSKIIARLNRANCNYYQENYKKFRKSLKASNKFFTANPESPLKGVFYNNGVLFYIKMSLYPRAEAYLNECRPHIFGKDRELDEAVWHMNSGLIYQLKGHYSEAIDQLQIALEKFRNILFHKHPYIASCFSNLSLAYTATNDPRALANAKEAKKIVLFCFRNKHSERAVIFSNLGKIYKEKGKINKARRYYEKSKSEFEAHRGQNCEGYSTCLNNIAKIQFEEGKFEEALENYNMSRNIRIEVFGHYHLLIASSWSNTGHVQLKLRRFEDSIFSFNESLKIHENYENSRGIIDAYFNIGKSYHLMGHKEEAKEYFQRSYAEAQRSNDEAMMNTLHFLVS